MLTKYAQKPRERKGQAVRFAWSRKHLNGSLAALGVAWTVLIGMTGCGYTIQHRLRGPFLSPQGVFVPVFENQTDEIGAERVFTDVLIRELQSRGEVVLSTREAGAMELRGVLRSLIYGPTAQTLPAFSGLQPYQRLPSEIGVTAVVSLSLIDPKTHQVLWSNDFSDFRRVQAFVNRTYNFQAPSSLTQLNQSIIESRYVDLAHDIMRDVYDDMIDLF